MNLHTDDERENMFFSGTQIRFLQDLIQDRPSTRPAGHASGFFCEHYGIGISVGRRIEYNEKHFQKAEQLLRSHDLPVSVPSDASRADIAANYGGLSEKSFSVAPHEKSVALRFIGACTLEEGTVSSPPGSYMVCTPEMAHRITCDAIMLVENFETFRTLERYAWIDVEGQAVLVVYRGDPRLSLSLDFVHERREPLWAFVDFDPAGLAIANALPHDRLQRLILPSLSWLEQASQNLRGRALFEQQKQYTRVLDASSHDLIRSWWGEMRRLRSAVVQEHMQEAH